VGLPAGPRDAVHFAGVGVTKALSASEGDDWRATAEPALPRRHIQGKSPFVSRTAAAGNFSINIIIFCESEREKRSLLCVANISRADERMRLINFTRSQRLRSEMYISLSFCPHSLSGTR
jgi:hypothetical protein